MGNLKEDYSVKIKAGRKSKGLTQEQLASLIGVSSKTISRYEQGIAEPGVDTLFSLSEVLDIEMSEFLYFSESVFNLKEAEEIYNYEMQLEDGYVELEKIINMLFSSFATLNIAGKREAAKRVEELTHFVQYTDKIAPMPHFLRVSESDDI